MHPAPYESGESPLPQLSKRIEQLEKENRGLRGIAANATASFMDDTLRAGLDYEKRRRWLIRAILLLAFGAAAAKIMLQHQELISARTEASNQSTRARYAERQSQVQSELLDAEHDLRVRAEGVIEAASQAVAVLEAALQERDSAAAIPVRRALPINPGDPEK